MQEEQPQNAGTPVPSNTLDESKLPSARPEIPPMYYQIMLTYLVEKMRGEVVIPQEYLLDKLEGKAPAELTVAQLTSGDVMLRVESPNVGKIIVRS